MSIINQALRDLDARKTDSEAHAASIHPVSVPTRASSKRLLWMALGLLLPMIGLALWFGLKPAPVGLPERLALAPVEPASPVAASASAPTPLPEAPLVVEPLIEPLNQHIAAPSLPKTATPALPPQVAEKVPLTPAKAMVSESPLKFSTEVPADVPAPERKLNVPATALGGVQAASISKALKKSTPEEDAEDRYRKALNLVNKGRDNQARSLLEEAIRLAPGHVAARQVLATLLNEAGLNREAETILREGRMVNPDIAWFAQSLARLQAARGDYEGAAATMQEGIEGKGVNAEYRATYAALLSRLKQHAEAAHQYELALKLQPDRSTWWMGLGLAQSAQGRLGEARAAYERALAAGNLSEKLEDFVRAKLSE